MILLSFETKFLTAEGSQQSTPVAEVLWCLTVQGHHPAMVPLTRRSASVALSSSAMSRAIAFSCSSAFVLWEEEQEHVRVTSTEDGGKWCSGLSTYTCRWVRRRSNVTSFLTSSKRRRLVGTIFSKIDKESCWIDASTAFMLT